MARPIKKTPVLYGNDTRFVIKRMKHRTIKEQLADVTQIDSPSKTVI
jgi:hypothetical protein